MGCIIEWRDLVYETHISHSLSNVGSVPPGDRGIVFADDTARTIVVDLASPKCTSEDVGIL